VVFAGLVRFLGCGSSIAETDCGRRSKTSDDSNALRIV